MDYSPSSTPEPTAAPARRRGRDRELSNPMPATFPEAQAETRRTAHWQLWLLLIILVSLAIALLAPTLLAIYFGGQERNDFLHGRAVDHFRQALAYEAEDYTELAIAELQIALKFDPRYQDAADKLKALQSGSGASGTPVPNSASVADQLFKGAQSAIAKQQWSDAIDYLEEIRRANPSYQPEQIQTLLIQAYLNGGNQSVAAGQVDQALARFSAVLTLDPSNADAKSLHDRAQLYINATRVMGTDWQSAVLDLNQLYQLDPNFYDVKQQLLNALVQYGDVASRQGAWCVAAKEYDQAVTLGGGTDAQVKLTQASASCRQAVLSPTATPTPLAAIGRFVAEGRVNPAIACQGTGSINGTVRDAQGNPLAGIMIRIYNDIDYRPAPFISDANGRYEIVLGRDAGLFHLVVVGPDGAPLSAVLDINYPGGTANGCHGTIDWTRSE